MRNTKNLRSDEGGLAIVEAAILLPFCILMVLAVYYASIFMCQRANLQANLQNTLIYYKNVDSDTYVNIDEVMTYALGASGGGTEVSAEGSGYDTPTSQFPYRFFGMEFSESRFTSFFRSMAGQMFFDEGDNIVIEADNKNYIIYKTITATAEQTVTPAIDLSMVGMPSSLTIRASGTVVVTSGDDFIRNVDFVTDIIAQTALGEKLGEIVEKAVRLYKEFKKTFNI